MTQKITRQELVERRFLDSVSEHELRVLRDDGLYRHLRCQRSGTYMYGFDLVTWPGYLAIVGDVGDYLFSRITDMFEFFSNGSKHPGGINPHYWAKKLQGAERDPGRQYEPEQFTKQVKQWLEWNLYLLGDDHERAVLARSVKEELLNREPPVDETEAHLVLREFSCEGIQIKDHWEWDLRDFTHRYLWCCFAITWGIRRYNEHKESHA